MTSPSVGFGPASGASGGLTGWTVQFDASLLGGCFQRSCFKSSLERFRATHMPLVSCLVSREVAAGIAGGTPQAISTGRAQSTHRPRSLACIALSGEQSLPGRRTGTKALVVAQCVPYKSPPLKRAIPGEPFLFAIVTYSMTSKETE